MQALADKKKVVEEEDIQALVNDELHQPEAIWELLTLQVCCRMDNSGCCEAPATSGRFRLRLSGPRP